MAQGLQRFQNFDYAQPPPLDLEQPPRWAVPYLKTLETLTDEELLLLRWQMKWRSMARVKQLPPKEFDGVLFNIWMLMSGRGFGKTLAGVCWLCDRAAATRGPYAAVSPTHDDVRHTVFEGVTGILAVFPPQLILDRNVSLPSVTLWNGSTIRGFAGDSPERLRGPQHRDALCDEIASWRYPDDAWSNLMFGLRLGERPTVMCVGTPKPTPFIRRLVKEKRLVLVRGTTYENRENLTKTFYDNVAKYEGTKIGRQELMGEILDPEEEGIVRRSEWRLWPNEQPLPSFQTIIMSLDTAFTEKTHDKKKQENDPTACSVWGVFEHAKMRCVLLLDAWEEWLGFDDLVRTVKRERDIKYGDANEPLMRPKLPSKQRPGPTGRGVDVILIEDIGSGKSLRQQLARENVLTVPGNPEGMDKLSRLHMVSPLFAHGRVWMIESDARNGQPKTWAEPLVSQVCSYTGVGSLEHDDLLDTTTQALKLVMQRYMDPLTVKRDPEEERRAAAAAAQARKNRRNPYDG